MLTVPSDIILEILIYCPIKTIENYLLTHKKAKLENYFWIKKFQKDHLPMINCGEWIVEYKKVYLAVHQSNLIKGKMNMFTTVFIKYHEDFNKSFTTICQSILPPNDYNQIFKIMNEATAYQEIYIHYDGNHRQLYYGLHYLNELALYRTKFILNDIKWLLINIFYHFPSIKITYNFHNNNNIKLSLEE